jgi:hypothetical protein
MWRVLTGRSGDGDGDTTGDTLGDASGEGDSGVVVAEGEAVLGAGGVTAARGEGGAEHAASAIKTRTDAFRRLI